MKQTLFTNFLLFISLGLVLFTSCQKDSLSLVEENPREDLTSLVLCEQSEGVKAKYEEDAVRLALNLMLEDSDASKSVHISQNYLQQSMDALMAVYNATHLAARDSVFSIYEVHTLPSVLDRMIVGVDPAHQWVRSWFANQQLTGNSQIDELLKSYDLSVVDHDNSLNIAVLSAADPLNIERLSRLFMDIEGVTYAEQEVALGDGNNIEIRSFNDHLELTFSIGYEDCPAMCLFHHYWQFKVFPDCSVEYIGSYGDELP